jgi:hypothetical protein
VPTAGIEIPSQVYLPSPHLGEVVRAGGVPPAAQESLAVAEGLAPSVGRSARARDAGAGGNANDYVTEAQVAALLNAEPEQVA